MTAVPTPTFGAKGFIPPSEPAILAGVTEDVNAAFGGNLNPSPATPQGQLASSLTAIIGNCNSLFLLYTNLVDPALSFGRMQDAIGRIYFIERIPSAPTIVSVVCTGAAGVVIPQGAVIQDLASNLYVCTDGGIINASGSITLTFANQLPGPIPCEVGTLDSSVGAQIYKAIPGWDSIANPTAGVLGQDVESPTAFETRRALSVAWQSIGSLPSVLGAVLSVAGVIDAYVYENTSNSPAVVGGVSLVPNSIYVCVLGGAQADVARAIWSRKAPGCAYNGNTTVSVQDTSQGYIPPYPTYQVTYETPLALPIVMSVVIANGPLVPNDVVTQVQNAVIGAFAGEDGGPRAKIGATVYASRYYSAIASLGSWARIVSILIGSPNSPGSVFLGGISGNVLTVLGISSGVIAVNQILVDSSGDLLPETTITAQLSGAPGGVGTYSVDKPQSVAAEYISGVVANLFEVPVNINQVPAISAANIKVMLGV